MQTYIGEPEDTLRFSRVNLSATDMVKSTKKLLGDTREAIEIVRRQPSTSCKSPFTFPSVPFIQPCFLFYLTFGLVFLPGGLSMVENEP